MKTDPNVPKNPLDLFEQRQSRRKFLTCTSALMAAAALPAAVPPKKPEAKGLQIIDAHIHFYDPTRPQGIPWPPKNEPRLYRQVLPQDYKDQPQPRAVAGAVVVEASPWLDDNEWILNLADRERLIAGFVGNLQIGDDNFEKNLKRLKDHWLFRGIRIRDEDASKSLHDPKLRKRFKLLADLDLALDVNGPPTVLLHAASLAQDVPKLRIVVDHIGNPQIDGHAPNADWMLLLRAAAKHKNVSCKVSGLVEATGRNDGSAPRDPDFYRPALNALWDIFGEDRLIYGSNWPVSSLYADLASVQTIPYEYFKEKGFSVLEKIFSGNAKRAYKWARRTDALRQG